LKALDNTLHIDNLIFVLLIPAIGIIVCIVVTYLITEGAEIDKAIQVENELKKQLIFSTVLLIPCLYAISNFYFPDNFYFIGNDKVVHTKAFTSIFGSITIGLVAGLIIGYSTEVMTSYSNSFVQELADSCKTGPATNIIYGLSLGYVSTIVPVVVLCGVCYYAHSSLGFYGVALAALGMLSNLPICLAIDGYGPISDNAGGIA